MTLRLNDYYCSYCGRVFETWHTNSHSNGKAFCRCGNLADLTWMSFNGMQPDQFWSGIQRSDVGYVTSKSQIYERIAASGQIVADKGIDRDIRDTKRALRKREKAIMDEKIDAFIGEIKDVKDPDILAEKMAIKGYKQVKEKLTYGN